MQRIGSCGHRCPSPRAQCAVRAQRCNAGNAMRDMRGGHTGTRVACPSLVSRASTIIGGQWQVGTSVIPGQPNAAQPESIPSTRRRGWPMFPFQPHSPQATYLLERSTALETPGTLRLSDHLSRCHSWTGSMRCHLSCRSVARPRTVATFRLRDTQIARFDCDNGILALT